MSTNSGPSSGLRPVRFRWSSTTMTDPVARSSRMPPAAAVRMTVRQPAAIPVRRGCTTSTGVSPSYRWHRPPRTRMRRPLCWTDQRVGSMPSCAIGRKEGQCVEGYRFLAGAQRLCRPRQAAAEEYEHVVVFDSQAATQFPGAVRRPVGGSLHGAMVEGHPRGGA